MLSHSFERFYVVTKYELLKVSDLKLTTIEFDLTCSYLDSDGKYMTKLKRHCLRIAPYISFYQRQVTYYNLTAHRILTKDIGLILPNFPINKRPKGGAILASVLGGIASRVIGLAYEEISSFLHQKRHKALNKAVTVIDKKMDLQKNQIHHLEDTMIMYGIYNSDTLTGLIRTVQNIQNITTWKEKTFAGKLTQLNQYYLNEESAHTFGINSILFLTTVRVKYVKMYERFIEQLNTYSKAIKSYLKATCPCIYCPIKIRKHSQGS